MSRREPRPSARTRPSILSTVEIGEPPCTCKQVKRRGDLGTPWVEVAYDPDCVYHFPQAAN